MLTKELVIAIKNYILYITKAQLASDTHVNVDKKYNIYILLK